MPQPPITLVLLALAFTARLGLSAPDDRPPGPPPSERERPKDGMKPPYRDRDGRGDGRDGHRGGPPGMRYNNGFDKLSEAEKKRVREAMDQAWQKPEMQAAKEKFMKASKEFRDSLHETLRGIDPEVVNILNKVESPMPWEQRGPPPLKPEDPEFVRHAVSRLGGEMIFFSKPDQRDAMRKLHERIMQLEPVKEAIRKMEVAPVEGRMETYRALREVYKKECEREISEFRLKRQQEGSSESEPKK